MQELQYAVVDAHGTAFSYIDSGPPLDSAISATYVTVFAIHGYLFSAHVFQNIIRLAPKYGIRIVAINRRDYPGSSPLSPEDNTIQSDGSDDQKSTFLRTRSIEFGTFISHFVNQHNLPPVSEDGKTGGIALLGWSLGIAFVHAIISSLDSFPAEIQSQFRGHLRAAILHDPPSIALGIPLPPQAWSPLVDTSIPPETRDPMFIQWVTTYFAHGDLSKRDLANISFVIPSTTKIPSIFTMTAEEKAQIVSPSCNSDMIFMLYLNQLFRPSYRKALFDREWRRRVPNMKVWIIAGDCAPPVSIPAVWDLETEDAAEGGGSLNTRWIKGGSHLVSKASTFSTSVTYLIPSIQLHWDDPETMLEAIVDSLV
ncbi:uncharacterized protein FIBRA_07201 [Fibroporia radiculosa]|uniref:Uncharacterized protein n=1 Tax=Fibroporia radiculosa TaxID=599839 RepID=J4I0B1_9APHY|nr:uncharacterized protein FIBRA_07201 [Fibroporia radiculosa]CCM05002.1 predicted protein [Fibroporia radiculosa]